MTALTYRKRFAKILATLGPASRAPDTMRLLHDVGVDAFRLNFSHGSHDDHLANINAIRAIEKETGTPIAIVADMQGPKLRVGEMGEGLELRYGETVKLRCTTEPSAGDIVFPHEELKDILKPGLVLKFDDGKLQVTVSGPNEARVDVPGLLKSRKGINVINAVLPMSAMTEKDKADMAFALEHGADWIALSFVQTAKDVLDARKIIQGKAGIIVKIEKPSAVEDLDSIMQATDAAMVARGDLGVELPLERVPVVQRKIIRKGRDLGKPVIVATHMLESMIDAPTPTRAEASDVATAIYQGADAVMLSAETAVGRHPATAVAIMDRIITAAEGDPILWEYFEQTELPHEASAEDAISRSIETIARTVNAKAVFGYTLTGSTVMRISRQRPPCRIVGLTPRARTASRLALVWGTMPVVTDDPNGFDDMLQQVASLATSVGLESGNRYMVSAGVPFGVPGTTNTLKLGQVD
ncbi:MAG: pyruvate kinase [Pseudomonadota bacterium]